MADKTDISVQVFPDTFVEMVWNEDDGKWGIFLNGPLAENGLEFMDEFEDETEARECLADEIRKVLLPD